MRRREFLGFLGAAAAAWPVVARAQQSVPVIGFLHQGSSGAGINGARFDAFRDGLREKGYVEGQNISIEYRGADKAGQLPELATELVRLNVRLIVAAGSEATHAAQRATRSIPIVMTSSSDPVGTGLVASLARPNGNITGMSLASPDLAGKRLELLREVTGDISPVVVLWKPDDPPAALSMKETEAAAHKLNIKLLSMGVTQPTEFDEAFTSAMKGHPKALVIVAAPMMSLHAGSIASLAVRHGLPAISFVSEFAKAGLLMSYGPSIIDSFRRSAGYVVKILAGNKPGDLPVEQPSKFELVINLKTAKVLGLDMPLILQQRADEVIE